MIKKLAVLVFVCMSLLSQAQAATATEAPQMADTFRTEGKIYVVITVIALIFLSLAGFLVYIERKVKKLEDKINKH